MLIVVTLISRAWKIPISCVIFPTLVAIPYRPDRFAKQAINPTLCFSGFFLRWLYSVAQSWQGRDMLTRGWNQGKIHLDMPKITTASSCGENLFLFFLTAVPVYITLWLNVATGRHFVPGWQHFLCRQRTPPPSHMFSVLYLWSHYLNNGTSDLHTICIHAD